MPETAPQMLWFAFFAGGAAGGWVLLCLFALEWLTDMRIRRISKGKK